MCYSHYRWTELLHYALSDLYAYIIMQIETHLLINVRNCIRIFNYASHLDWILPLFVVGSEVIVLLWLNCVDCFSKWRLSSDNILFVLCRYLHKISRSRQLRLLRIVAVFSLFLWSSFLVSVPELDVWLGAVALRLKLGASSMMVSSSDVQMAERHLDKWIVSELSKKWEIWEI